ncbi:hypothetical protein [Endozoicomonas montiporae]|nr:hypothetical protein [Endozoicomonas montiporae]
MVRFYDKESMLIGSVASFLLAVFFIPNTRADALALATFWHPAFFVDEKNHPLFHFAGYPCCLQYGAGKGKANEGRVACRRTSSGSWVAQIQINASGGLGQGGITSGAGGNEPPERPFNRCEKEYDRYPDYNNRIRRWLLRLCFMLSRICCSGCTRGADGTSNAEENLELMTNDETVCVFSENCERGLENYGLCIQIKQFESFERRYQGIVVKMSALGLDIKKQINSGDYSLAVMNLIKAEQEELRAEMRQLEEVFLRYRKLYCNKECKENDEREPDR